MTRCPLCMDVLTIVERSIGICEECVSHRMIEHNRPSVRVYAQDDGWIMMDGQHLVKIDARHSID